MTKMTKRVLRGYNRLAFGEIQDAVRLLFSDGIDDAELDNMDLFNVAEIRRPKGGGMEIKFFDRLKALQCMEMLNAEEKEGVSGFYHALQESTRAFERDSV